MNDLFYQMLADFKPYVKPEKWDDFEKRHRESVERLGSIVHIEDIYILWMVRNCLKEYIKGSLN